MFSCASSSELWAQSEIVRAKLFHATGTCQTLAYAIDSDHRLLLRSGHFSMGTM